MHIYVYKNKIITYLQILIIKNNTKSLYINKLNSNKTW